MLTSYLAMQSAIINRNIATMNLVKASDEMLNSAVSFGNSQPLKPSFSAELANHDLKQELSIKANETKLTVSQKLIQALEKALARDIEKSTPNYAGLDYKA